MEKTKEVLKNVVKVLLLVLVVIIGTIAVRMYQADLKITDTLGKVKRKSILAEDTVIEWNISKEATDNVKAKLNIETGLLIISGKGEMKDYYYVNEMPWESYKDKINCLKIKEGITRIGNYSFRNCKKLSSIEISNSVKSIGKEAFYRCINISNIEIPNSVISIEKDAFFRLRKYK